MHKKSIMDTKAAQLGQHSRMEMKICYAPHPLEFYLLLLPLPPPLLLLRHPTPSPPPRAPPLLPLPRLSLPHAARERRSVFLRDLIWHFLLIFLPFGDFIRSSRCHFDSFYFPFSYPGVYIVEEDFPQTEALWSHPNWIYFFSLWFVSVSRHIPLRDPLIPLWRFTPPFSLLWTADWMVYERTKYLLKSDERGVSYRLA